MTKGELRRSRSATEEVETMLCSYCSILLHKCLFFFYTYFFRIEKGLTRRTCSGWETRQTKTKRLVYTKWLEYSKCDKGKVRTERICLLFNICQIKRSGLVSQVKMINHQPVWSLLGSPHSISLNLQKWRINGATTQSVLILGSYNWQ